MEDIEVDNLEIVIRADSKVVWINAEKCVFRAYINGKITVDDRRSKKEVCPECGNEMSTSDYGYYCSNKDCGLFDVTFDGSTIEALNEN